MKISNIKKLTIVIHCITLYILGTQVLNNFSNNSTKFKVGDCIAYKKMEDDDVNDIVLTFKFQIIDTSNIGKYPKYHAIWLYPNIKKNESTDFYIDVADWGMKKIECPNE